MDPNLEKLSYMLYTWKLSSQIFSVNFNHSVTTYSALDVTHVGQLHTPKLSLEDGGQLRTLKLSLAEAEGEGPIVTLSLLLCFFLRCGFPKYTGSPT